ncbi:MAG: hypothetical protein IPG50_15110 [Myxococcales bacterium]|nr:hypothetical protein [Myxococcales bacterium]
MGLSAMSVVACSAMGCSSTTEEDTSDDALTDLSGKWVVDMAKVTLPTNQGGYGRSSKLFFGLTAQEYGICKPEDSAEACAAKPALWDQALRFGPEGTADAPTFRKPYPNDRETPLIKTADGKIVGPKGKGLNIIPLLKNTDPLNQTHLRKWLKNGDALAFFHPEQTSMRNLMDRRVSHVAMHYDYKSPLNGKEFVHHIDNPNNYGPRYNYPPSRNMPFHVFRYQPKDMDAKKAEAYAMAGRNWAFLNDDLSPFADFFDLQVQTKKDLREKFATRLLAGNESAEVYCSGLAFLNLNLGTNHTLKPGALTKEYKRQETGETFSPSDCTTGNEDKCVLAPAKLAGVEVASLESRGKLFAEPYTTGELATAWLDNTYGELPPEKRAAIAAKPSRFPAGHPQAGQPDPSSAQAQLAQGLYNVQWSDGDSKPEARVGEPAQAPAQVTAPENLKAWGDSYGATLAFATAMKNGDTAAAAAANTAFINAQSIKAKNGQVIPMAQLIADHNAAVPQGQATDPDKWITIDPAKMTASQILRALEVAHVTNRFWPPRAWMDTSEDRVWVPGGFDSRTESKGELVYVGTVISCELLSPADGTAGDACGAEGTGMDQFSEGGADSSTYPHYAIGNGGERTHRRFDASTFRPPAPTQAFLGKGTKLTLRATSHEMSDVKFLLHTPEFYKEGYTPFVEQLFSAVPDTVLSREVRAAGLSGLSVRDYDAACTAMNKVAASQQRHGTCAPKRAIVLDPSKAEVSDVRAVASGAAADAVYTFDLTKVCTIGSPDAPTMKCPVVSQKEDGTWDFANVQSADVSRATAGLISATMTDVGQVATSAAPVIDPASANASRDERAYGLCSACGTGGAHFNQWTITIRNDR